MNLSSPTHYDVSKSGKLKRRRNANMFERVCTILGRLLVICKTLNDVVIPKANVFLRYGENCLSVSIWQAARRNVSRLWG